MENSLPTIQEYEEKIRSVVPPGMSNDAGAIISEVVGGFDASHPETLEPAYAALKELIDEGVILEETKTLYLSRGE